MVVGFGDIVQLGSIEGDDASVAVVTTTVVFVDGDVVDGLAVGSSVGRTVVGLLVVGFVVGDVVIGFIVGR